MIREADLVSYLPPFIAEFKEITAALEAENPEFTLVWNAADKVLRNEFIETADEYGIARFEKMLNIFPSAEDTLESRRARIMTRWFIVLPYTVRTLIKKLISLCGENNFSVETDFDFYRITVETKFELFGQIEELEKLLDTMIPCNMIVNTYNRISSVSRGGLYFGGIVRETYGFKIGADLDKTEFLRGSIYAAGSVAAHHHEIIIS